MKAEGPTCRDWKGDLRELLAEVAAAAAEGKVAANIRRRFRAIWRAARGCEECREATAYTERGITYTRRLLIAAGRDDAARELYGDQRTYQRACHRIQGRRLRWASESFLWLVAGSGHSALGLARLFVVIVFVLLGGFALLYRYPSPGISYQAHHELRLRWYHYVYFSGKTLTTVGYGDIHPRPDNPRAMMLAVTEAMLGYILLGSFIYALMQYRRPPPPPPPRAEDDWEKKLLAGLK